MRRIRDVVVTIQVKLFEKKAGVWLMVTRMQTIIPSTSAQVVRDDRYNSLYFDPLGNLQFSIYNTKVAALASRRVFSSSKDIGTDSRDAERYAPQPIDDHRTPWDANRDQIRTRCPKPKQNFSLISILRLMSWKTSLKKPWKMRNNWLNAHAIRTPKV